MSDLSTRKNLTGQQFGRLTVLNYAETRKCAAYWRCQCECGNQKTVRANSLTSGRTTSCGCRGFHYEKRPVEQDETAGIARIPLSGKLGDGKYTTIDLADLPLVAGRSWRLDRNGYAYTWIYDGKNAQGKSRSKRLSLHRLLCRPQPEANQLVDHRDRDRLNNHRNNLRASDKFGNSQNAKAIGGASKFKGVDWCKSRGHWRAYIMANGTQHYLGSFHDEIGAAKAWDAAARELHGEFAVLNFPD